MPGSIKTPFPEISFISQYFTQDFKGAEFLLPAEALIVKGSAEKRRTDFSTGRYCAHQALGQLIDQQSEILQGKGREPLWPAGVVGSISHSDKLAGAVVARNGNVSAIGLDIETVGGVKEELWNMLFHDVEQTLIRSKKDDAHLWATLLFSLKEAFYKLQCPITGLFLDFTDVLVSESNGILCISGTNPQHNFCPIILSNVIIHWVQKADQLILICYIK